MVFGQRVQLWWDPPLLDSFELLRSTGSRRRYRANLAAFREQLELDPFLDTPVRQLSLGQRVRGELTAAMLHDPELLFLDEPTIGLDVVAKARVREFLTTTNRERGLTVLLTTHDPLDIERLCRRMLIIDHGHVIYDGAIEALIDRYGEERTLIVDLEEAEPHSTSWVRGRPRRGPAPVAAPGPAGCERGRADGRRRRLRFVDLAIEEPDIEEIVRRIYVEGVAESATSSSRVRTT